MRKIIAFGLTILTSVILCACTMPKPNNSEKPNGLSQPFKASMNLTIEDMEAQGTVCRYGTGMWEAEFTSPKTLSGVKLEFEEGNVTASYKGLSFSVPQSALPVKAMMLNLMSAADDLAANPQLSGVEENGLLKISGNLEGGEYTLTTDSNGNLTAFEMPNNKLKITFSEVIPIETTSTQPTESSSSVSETVTSSAETSSVSETSETASESKSTSVV